MVTVHAKQIENISDSVFNELLKLTDPDGLMRYTAHALRNHWEPELKDGIVLFIKENKIIVSWVLGFVLDDEYVVHAFTAQEYRNKGYASKLVALFKEKMPIDMQLYHHKHFIPPTAFNNNNVKYNSCSHSTLGKLARARQTVLGYYL